MGGPHVQIKLPWPSHKPLRLNHIRTSAGVCIRAQHTTVKMACDYSALSGPGVSNFELSELSELWQKGKVKPAVVQRNSDPLNPDTLVQLYARLTGMQYQVYTLAFKAFYFACMPSCIACMCARARC